MGRILHSTFSVGSRFEGLERQEWESLPSDYPVAGMDGRPSASAATIMDRKTATHFEDTLNSLNKL